MTFDLPSGKYWPYKKPNNEPLYIHSKSNHPPSILKHLPKNINDRLSSISCDEAEFDKAKPAYEQALKNSGFNSTLTYTAPHNCNNLRVQNGNANGRETSYGSTLHLTKMSPLTLVDVFSNFLTYISTLDIHITGFSIEIL